MLVHSKYLWIIRDIGEDYETREVPTARTIEPRNIILTKLIRIVTPLTYFILQNNQALLKGKLILFGQWVLRILFLVSFFTAK